MLSRTKRIYIKTLGCSKNQVDSEVLLAQAQANGLEIVSDISDSEILIINTCGFIADAKQESIDEILDAAELRKAGTLKKLYVMGCLSDRYPEELRKEIPEVDSFFKSSHTSVSDILAELGGHYKKELIGERVLTTPSHYAYMKISEGCDHTCSFCAIPLMRGTHVSRPIEELVHEARLLHQKGVRELILIAQDLTWYGLDLYGKRILSELLKRLSDCGFDWIRLQYAYPARFPMDILPVIRERENMCKYLDMPIQHISDPVLKSMRRGITGERTRELLHQIRSEVPGIRLRTTLITGYPGETEEHFDELLDFIETFRFERLGCFPYSREEATIAWDLGDPVTDEEKQRRVRLIMQKQEEISFEHNQQLIGQTLPVLIDRIEDETAFGRTEWDTPEVDNEVIISLDSTRSPKRTITPGHFYTAEIVDAEAFDLFGHLLD
ncbi:30S ribosomal protein S12 methylthiotransferase RimO [Balneolaceae bacterium ANBcel3]|nr:30S ribosomal protein S12 methylthiotransferase RimO [Balneolaceae bacterium ANBcel3]